MHLTVGGIVYPTYCVVTNGFEAWALILKQFGGLTTFTFNAALWTNRLTHNTGAVSGGLDTQEYKSALYWQYPFTVVRLGMNGPRTSGSTNWGTFTYSAASLFSVIADGGKFKSIVYALMHADVSY